MPVALVVHDISLYKPHSMGVVLYMMLSKRTSTKFSFIGLICIYFNRFLALKNLATVFLQQGPAHHENALCCYLQAAEIDAKDSVVWNQLGTLSCSMGLLSTSRWAFEQGLFCSPNNCKHFHCLFVSVYLEQASLF